MTAPVSFGFLRPGRNRFDPGPWIIVVENEQALESPNAIPNWDYFTNLRVVREVEVDLPGLLNDCGLKTESSVSATIAWQSSWTGLRGTSVPVPLKDGENVLELELVGENLGGRLALDTRVTLSHAVSSLPLAPRRVGSTLWSDATRVALEGTGARFPVVPASFEESGLAGGRPGAWYLSIESNDLTASSNGSLRLYLNSSHPAVKEMLSKPSSPGAQALETFIHYDVARQLVVQALLHEYLDDENVYDPDSLGEMFLALLRALFPDRDMRTLRGDFKTAPGELEAEIQGRMGLLVS